MWVKMRLCSVLPNDLQNAPKPSYLFLDSDSKAEIKTCSSEWFPIGSKVIFPSAVIYFSQQSHWCSPSEKLREENWAHPHFPPPPMGFCSATALQETQHIQTCLFSLWEDSYLHALPSAPRDSPGGTRCSCRCGSVLLCAKTAVSGGGSSSENSVRMELGRGERGCMSKKHTVHARVFGSSACL